MQNKVDEVVEKVLPKITQRTIKLCNPAPQFVACRDIDRFALSKAISSGVLCIPSKYTSKEVFNRIKLICNNFVGTKMDHTAICSLYSQIEEFGDFVYHAAQTKKPTE